MTSKLELVTATANPDKLVEILAILGNEVTLLPRPPEVPDVVEDAPDLVGNARLKAVAIANASGHPALADDTGLEVDWLDGRPGVHSARYSGPDATYESNVTMLLAELAGVTGDDRGAQFRTVVMVRWPDGREVMAEGVVLGVIGMERTGDGGFGYDPVFVPLEADGLTFAQMSPEAKHAISHRGRALRALQAKLAEQVQQP